VPLIERNFTFLKKFGTYLCIFHKRCIAPQHTCADFLQLLIIPQNGGDSTALSGFIVLKTNREKCKVHTNVE